MTTLIPNDHQFELNSQDSAIPDCANISKQGWKARLNLQFSLNNQGTKTILSHRSHQGPLTVQRPFYPEGGVCHVYLLHPPGGVVAGDQLTINIDASSKSEALVTTPAAGKFYRSAGDYADQLINLKVDENATLEWLPQETIIYQGAKLKSKVTLQLAQNARFIGWEILALGRPAANEGFESGEVLLNWQILDNNKPLYLEKMRLDADAFIASWGLNSQSVFGTLFAYPATTTQLELVRELIGSTRKQGVTLVDDLLICRASHAKTEPVRNFFEKVRAAIRADIIQHEAYTPRIWAT